MSRDDEEQEKRGFKVEDRRRFSDTGEARPERADAPEPAPPPTAGEASGSQKAPDTRQSGLPPVELNFSTFVISLSTQALVHLGEIPDPIAKQVSIDLGAASQMIDILGILRDKTKGNLDQSEADLIEGLLYDLRLRFVERTKR